MDDVDLDAFHAHPPVDALDENALLHLGGVYDTAALINDQSTCNVVVNRVTQLLRPISRPSPLDPGQQRGLSVILQSVLNDYTSNARVRPFLKLTMSALPCFDEWEDEIHIRFDMLQSVYRDVEVSGMQSLEKIFTCAARGGCVFHDNCEGTSGMFRMC